jgi:hypothetical protein
LAALAAAACGHPARAGPAERGVVVCGPGRPVPGYSDHRSYPSTDPQPPAFGTRIVGCFASLADAIRHGFALAEPHGTVIVDGVYLVPTGAAAIRQCRAAARALRFAVPCPALAPTIGGAPLQTLTCQDIYGCVADRKTFYFEENGFVAPPAYQGAAPGSGHVVILAERVAAPALGSRELFCLGRPAIRMAAIGPSRAAFAACPQGNALTSGHLMLRWVDRGILAGVSFHGVSPANFALALAVARHLAWITPRA